LVSYIKRRAEIESTTIMPIMLRMIARSKTEGVTGIGEHLRI
jgi:hypothetical protein